MRYLQRYLSLLFALVMCVGLFSTTAHAEKVNYDNSNIYVSVVERFNGEQSTVGQFAFNANDSQVENTTFTEISDVYTSEYNQYLYFYLQRNDQTMLFSKGGAVEVTIENMMFSTLFQSNNDLIPAYNCSYMQNFGATVYYTDNTTVSVTAKGTRDSNGWYDVKINFTPEKDVQYILLSTNIKFLSVAEIRNFITNCQNRGLEHFTTTTFIGEYDNRSFNVTIDQDSKEVGLLQDIGNKLSDGFNNMIKGITELPQKLWEKISDGLKGLFVPSEESMTAYKDKWDELLSSRFGAVYQVVNIMTDSWDGIMQADQTDTISFPQATLNFSGTPFTFGGYDVKIVPDGFDVLVTAIKSIVAIVCTVAFVNGLRKRYDEIMGVEQ